MTDKIDLSTVEKIILDRINSHEKMEKLSSQNASKKYRVRMNEASEILGAIRKQVKS